MKILLAQPAVQRFQWELDVLLSNIRQFTDMEVVLLFAEKEFTIPLHFRKMQGVSVFTYPNRHEIYLPAVRPYLLWQYFKADPAREQEQYLYIDSDIIFREWPELPGLSAGMVQGASCDGYIGYKYIAQCARGPEIASMMAEIAGITVDQMKNVPGIGAQLILNQPTAAFWERNYADCYKLYNYLESLGTTTNIQKWTAEMWVQLWGWVRENKTVMVSDELAFCLPTDPISRWNEVKILHNAGVQPAMSGEMFWKGQYVDTSPIGKNLSWVKPDKCSYYYAQAVQKVVG